MDSEFLLVLYALMTSQPASDVLYAQQQQQLTRILSSPFPPVYYRISTHFIGPPSASFFSTFATHTILFFFSLVVGALLLCIRFGDRTDSKKRKKNYNFTIIKLQYYYIQLNQTIGFFGGVRGIVSCWINL